MKLQCNNWPTCVAPSMALVVAYMLCKVMVTWLMMADDRYKAPIISWSADVGIIR